MGGKRGELSFLTTADRGFAMALSTYTGMWLHIILNRPVHHAEVA